MFSKNHAKDLNVKTDTISICNKGKRLINPISSILFREVLNWMFQYS